MTADTEFTHEDIEQILNDLNSIKVDIRDLNNAKDNPVTLTVTQDQNYYLMGSFISLMLILSCLGYLVTRR